ncbi:ASCH domain-containing protein [Thermoproteus tenax]|uniref:Predicted RNA-binding protein, PUA domain like fold n=1 Tax=Thermoproteus tenax (strain ATCC 35583 / DSM 2078 / JCM 9277 / NBRC 100435 / Kra 1) TaxID=768679 RepID=G4RL80_THETK|nr:ASCH domain-containing protein [Thermoproteus tenax]CCC82325.1 predicted RNA-binding protein, PUA domain like fold [Thermoproteus tenax Kra 1]
MPRNTLGPFLSFKEKYLRRVLDGDKKVTIRLGALRPRFQLVYIVCCDMIYGEAIITGVEYLRLRDVPLDVLRADGFNSLEEALAELKSLYPDISANDIVSVVRFIVVRRYERPVPTSLAGKRQ